MQQNLFEPLVSDLSRVAWTPTRAAGLERLRAFLPAAGAAYTRARNTDFGPENRANVSALSPWIARRLITEAEVVDAVLQRHSFVAAEKFIQEVFWRTYWKGWLEMRPSVLLSFNQSRTALRKRLEINDALATDVRAAQAGQTGIVCFDTWVNELRTFGWLHNHTRMWFASIWIFTLGLPWQLGAEFFYKHLLDADAASNTLSWRWVAGLHTKGKHYLARASNIATHTNGRFDPSGQLNENAGPLSESYQTPGPGLIPVSGNLSGGPVGLLLNQEDLSPHSLDLRATVKGAAIMSMPTVGEIDSPRNMFDIGALDDAATRTAGDFNVDVGRFKTLDEIRDWAVDLGVKEIATAYAPTGLIAWEMGTLREALKRESIELVQIRRNWDSNAWPLATGGFFKLKEKLPRLIQDFSRK